MTIRSIRDSGLEVDPYGVLSIDLLGDLYPTDAFTAGPNGNLLIDPKVQFGPGITTVVNGQVISVPFFCNAVQEFNSSGSFVVPAGVSRVLAMVVGGGGGGGFRTGNDLIQGGDTGGPGGFTLGIIDVSGTETATVGAGGAGNDAGNASGGGTSSFATLTATGGGAVSVGTGASGVGTGGDIRSGSAVNNNWITNVDKSGADGFLLIPGSPAEILWDDIQPNNYSTNSNGNTASRNWTSANTFRPGGGGVGETNVNLNNASGGIEGTVIVFYYDETL